MVVAIVLVMIRNHFSVMLIDFEFESGPENQKYRFVVRNGRTKNGEPKTFERASYGWENENWVPLNLKDASSIFDLSYDNFRRTVIIPQGRFSDFLQLTGGERTKMMVELFPQLADFEFSDQVSKLLSHTKDEISKLEGQLLEIGQTGAEEIKSKEEEIENLKTALSEQKEILSAQTSRFNALEEVRLMDARRKELEEQFQKLEGTLPEIEKKKLALDRFELAFRTFHSDIQFLDQAVLDHKKSESETQNLRSSEKGFLEIWDKARELAEKARLEAAFLPGWEIELKELGLQIQKTGLLEKVNHLKQEAEKKGKAKSEVQIRKDQSAKEAKEIREKLDQFVDSAEERENLIQIKQLRTDEDRLRSELLKRAQVLSNLDLKINQLKEKKEKIVSHPLVNSLPGRTKETSIIELIQLLEVEKKNLKQRIQTFKEQQLELGMKQQLFHFSQQLANEEPCPLCGSTHHPHVLTAEDVGLLSARKTEELSAAEADENLLSEQTKELEILFAELKSVIKDQKERQTDHQNLVTEKSANLERIENHSLKHLDPEEINQKLTDLEKQKIQLVARRTNLENKENEVKRLEVETDQLNALVIKLDQEIAGLEGQIQTLENQSVQNEKFDSEPLAILESRQGEI